MKKELTTKESQIVDEVASRPKKLHWWQKLGAYFTFALETLKGRKGGG